MLSADVEASPLQEKRAMAKRRERTVKEQREACFISNGFFYVPNKGSKAQLLRFKVKGVKSIEQRVHTVVVGDGEHGAVHGGPGMAAVVRLAALAASPLHLREEAEAALPMMVEESLNALFVSLVVSNKNGFHSIR